MRRPYATLRGLLVTHDLKQVDIARKLLVSPRHVNSKMCGHVPWTLDEMYTLMDLLGWPYDRMHELFPKDGISPKSA